VTEETRFDVASVTELFASVAVPQQVASGGTESGRPDYQPCRPDRHHDLRSGHLATPADRHLGNRRRRRRGGL
jgi:hypothetical protein